jgi:hypothetical protein
MQLLMSDSEALRLTVSKDADDLEWNYEDNNWNIHDDEDGHTSDLTDHIVHQVRVYDALSEFANT